METVVGEYARARKMGLKQVDEAFSRGGFPYPRALDDACPDWSRLPAVSIGTMEIPLSLVGGTVTRGRQGMFSCGFLPIAEEGSEFSTKWEALLAHQLEEGISDPIRVYEYLQRFYVLEGNKRVSVARFLGMAAIDAQVTRIMPAHGTPEAEAYDEFLRFWAVCPLYGLDFSKPGSYLRMAKLLGRSLDEPWPTEQVQRLRSAFALFSRAYEGKKAARAGASAADAFLVYLQAYATSDPLAAGEGKMSERIRAIMGELKVASQDEPIAYASELPEAKGVVPSIRSTVRQVVGRRPVHLAFIYDKTPQTSGWIALHELGREALSQDDEALVRTSAYAGCSDEESFAEAVESALADDADLVVTVSPRQFEQTLRAAVAHPKARFVNCSIKLSSDKVRTFYARMYEAKFVLGALAACLATNHQIGYLAVSPIYGAMSEINAFALGAAMIDPEATIHLEWVTSDAVDWRAAMRAAGVSVLSGLDFSDPADDEKPCGLCTVAEDGTMGIAAMPVWDWSRYYALIARAIRDESWGKDAKATRDHARNYWPGMGSGVVRIQCSEELAEGHRRLVDALGNAVAGGALLPFDARIVDQGGRVRRELGQDQLPDEELASMSWLAANVSGRLPRRYELSDDGRRAVEASGVIPADDGAGAGER